MSGTSWAPGGAVVLATVALISAGCSNGSAENGSTAASTSAVTGTKLTASEKAVKFAECIRAHGVPHFPDPDAKGEFRFGLDVTPAVWEKAVDACKDLEPPGAVSGQRNAKQQSRALKFAACMRAKGVKDFPDPVNGEPVIDTTKIRSANRPGGLAVMNATRRKCSSVLGVAANGGPVVPGGGG